MRRNEAGAKCALFWWGSVGTKVWLVQDVYHAERKTGATTSALCPPPPPDERLLRAPGVLISNAAAWTRLGLA
eukprot:2765405-Rhodomonas_salina.1